MFSHVVRGRNSGCLRAGGAAAVGNDVGGSGTDTYATWSAATSTGVSGYYAGGGSYGTNGSKANGGGGSGNTSNGGCSSANQGTTNSGSGGGGYYKAHVGFGGAGCAGGSGVVIVRYPV